MKLIKNHNRAVFKPWTLAQMLFVHLGAVAVMIYHLSWTHFLIGFAVAAVTGYAMGIFHHMQLTHKSFESKSWITYMGSLFGALSWRGPFAPPLKYVAMHRVHHVYSDTEYDPHTPEKGLFFAFMGWQWKPPFGLDEWKQYQLHIPEYLKKDRVLVFIDKYTNALQFVLMGLSFGVGYLWNIGMSPWMHGLVCVGYFVCVKSLIVIWGGNAVDLINHTMGYRSFETSDKSTNSLWMAAIHLGGAISWHNNHHAHPGYFYVKSRWWELDVHYLFLRVLQSVGLVSNIKTLDVSKGYERKNKSTEEVFSS